QRQFRRSADWTRVELLAAYQVAERFEIAGIVERSMRDERTVPYTVEIARARVVRIATARLLAEDGDRDAVAAALDAERVEWLMQIADQMHEELGRDRAIRAIEGHVRQPLLVVGNAIDDAVAPLVEARAGRHRRLQQAVAIAIVAGRVGRNVDEMPV